MPDTPNQSSSGSTPNKSMADVGSSGIPSSILKALQSATRGINTQSYQRETQLQSRQQEVLDEIEQIQALVARAKAEGKALPNIPEFSTKALNSLPNRQERAADILYRSEQKQQSMFSSSQRRALGMVETEVNRAWSSSSINSDVAGRLEQIGTQSAGLRLTGTLSPIELQERMKINRAALSAQEEAVRGLLPNLQNPNKKAEALGQLGTLYQQREATVSELGQQEAARRAFKIQDRDPQSIATNVARAQMVREGDPLYGSAQKLIAAFDAVADRAGKSAEELKKLDENLEKSSQSFGGGRGGGDRYGFAAGMLGAGGNLVQQIGVNQTLGAMQNRGALAGLENQKYDMYRKARAGDVASQMALSQWGNAEFFGSEVKTAQNVALGLYGTAGVAQGVAGAAKADAAGAELFNPVSWVGGSGPANAEAAQRGVKEAADGAAQAAIAGADVVRGVSGNQVRVAGTQSYMQAVLATNQITAEQLQGFRDYSTGLGTVARGMGGRGGDFLRSTRNMLPNIATAGLSPQQFVEMSQFGQDNMGSMFNQDQIFAARGLERSGVGTREENMQRMSMLAAAGSNNPQAGLAGVLEASFSKSLDSAKSLSALVKNTADMAGKSVAGRSGLDAVAATATMIATGIDPNQANREVAVQRARTAAETADQIVTDRSVSFTNMAKISRIQQMTKMGGEDAVYAAGLDVATLGTVAGMDADKQAEFLRAHGVSATNKTAGGMVDNLRKAAGVSILARGTVGQSGVNTDELYDKILRGDTLNEKEQTQAGRAAMQGGFASAADMERSIRGVAAKNDPNAGGKVKDDLAGRGGSQELRDADELLTGGFKQLAEAAAAAAGKLGGATAAMQRLLELQRNADKEGGAKGEGEFSEAGPKAADSTWFSEGAKTLNTAAGKWDNIAEKLIKAGIGNSSTQYRVPVDQNTKRGASPGGK